VKGKPEALSIFPTNLKADKVKKRFADDVGDARDKASLG
jgi:hypothetical protein